MNTQVTFRSSKFPPYDGEEDQINPGLWGKRLAEYLVENLKGKGIETEEPIPEDWGWYIPVKADGPKVAVCCGHQQGEDDEFLCFTDPAKPVVKKLFKKVDVTQHLGPVAKALEDILAADPEITQVEWYEG